MEAYTLRQIADIVGVGAYPEALEEVYAKLTLGEPAVDLRLIDQLQREFNVFDEFYETVRELGAQLNADPARSAWVRTAVKYAMAGDMAQARAVPVPEPDGTPLTDFLPLYILLPQIPGSVAEYRRRGFTEAEMPRIMNNYKAGIRITCEQTGRPGINALYYSWLTLFVKSRIFYTGSLQFEVKTLPTGALWLKNRQSGQIVPLILSGKIHASGIQKLGSIGYEDEDGAFEPVFSEDEESYFGNPAINSVVEATPRKFLKSEWDCVGRPGDSCLGVHIPRGADISLETVKKTCASARRIAAERYPECSIGVLYCASWMLDPKLETLMGKESRLAGFMNCFVKYPNKDPGTAVFGFVFPKRYESYETLPEDTSLRRKLKQLYVDGGRIYAYSGIISIEE